MGARHYRFILLLLCALVLFPFAGAAEEIVLTADAWCPVNCEPDSDQAGYAVELARAIFEPLGHTITYRVYPFARASRAVAEGRFTALIAASRENQEEQLTYPNTPLGILENDYYTHVDSTWKYTGPLSLEGKNMGTIYGYDYGEIEEALQNGTTNVQIAGGEYPLLQLLRKLTLHRLDIVVDWGPVVEYTARRNGLMKDLRHAGRGGNAVPLYLAFAPGREDLAALWDQGMDRLRQTGELDMILARYDLTPEDCGL